MLVAHSKQSGFSLIEMVIGITTFAVAMTIVTAVLVPQITKTADPIYQVRATELAQSMFNEILGKYYDENADRSGGKIRCNEDLVNDADETSCTDAASLGPDITTSTDNIPELTRPRFDDIDDYHGYGTVKDASGNIVSFTLIQNSLGQDIGTVSDGNLYEDFGIDVEVFYDADQNGIADAVSGNIKLIKLTVYTPTGEQIVFSSYKHNY